MQAGPACRQRSLAPHVGCDYCVQQHWPLVHFNEGAQLALDWQLVWRGGLWKGERSSVWSPSGCWSSADWCLLLSFSRFTPGPGKEMQMSEMRWRNGWTQTCSLQCFLKLGPLQPVVCFCVLVRSGFTTRRGLKALFTPGSAVQYGPGKEPLTFRWDSQHSGVKMLLFPDWLRGFLRGLFKIL